MPRIFPFERTAMSMKRIPQLVKNFMSEKASTSHLVISFNLQRMAVRTREGRNSRIRLEKFMGSSQ